jgi:DNA-binding LacI/PurR family transcriptional regulator
MGVTIDEVAARTNLNKGSVSRILNGKGDNYSLQTRERVLQTAAEMGYQPNFLARALWTGETHSIALWLLAHDSYSPYFGYVHHCMQRLGIQHSYQLITENIPLAAVEQTESFDLVRWPVDGILSCDLTHVAASYVRSKMGRKCPIVCLGQGYVPDQEHLPDTDYVHVDLYAGAREAIAHLLTADCRRIALVSNQSAVSGSSAGDPRAVAYTELLSEAGREAEYVAIAEDSRRGGYEGMKDHVTRHGCPDGLFCVNDEIAIGCYMALHELGIGVPDDVLLVGYDGLENARFLPCPISSVVIPIDEMCSLAWDMLMQRIKNPDMPLQQRVLVPRLEVRASSHR